MELEDKSKMDVKTIMAQTRNQELARIEAKRQETEAQYRIIQPIVERASQWLKEVELPRDTKSFLSGAAVGAFGLWLFSQGGSGSRKRRRSNS